MEKSPSGDPGSHCEDYGAAARNAAERMMRQTAAGMKLLCPQVAPLAQVTRHRDVRGALGETVIALVAVGRLSAPGHLPTSVTNFRSMACRIPARGQVCRD
jgi:hypothetical protein